MVAEFYILTQSFSNNQNFSVEEIERKSKMLAVDFVKIKKYKETNRLLIHVDTYDVNFMDGTLLKNILFSEEGKQRVDRDVFNALLKIFVESEQTAISSQEVIDVLLNQHDPTICHGLIAFHQVDNVDPAFQVIYNHNGWLKFRRHFLGLYPRDPEFFIDECTKYFPKLYFHTRTKGTIGRLLAEVPRKMIYHFSALNDEFRVYQQQQLNRTEVLKQFSAGANLDATATLEGNASKKPLLTFVFTNNKGQSEAICCEPHLKLCYSDQYPGDTHYSNNRRIYFHEGRPNVAGGAILIGHIGQHL